LPDYLAKQRISNIVGMKEIEDIQVFSINTGFIFIEWCENKYFMSGGSHE
jgi:peroxiredoxin